jgi:integrase
MSNDTITLPASVTKNKIEHTFPLSPSATALIDRLPHHKDCPYLFPASRTVSERTTVFNGWGKGKELIDQETGVTNWTLHDIRRTVASGMASLGVQQIVVEKLLNHVSGGTQSPISRVYNKHKYLDEMRDAVLLWDRYLANLDVPEA